MAEVISLDDLEEAQGRLELKLQLEIQKREASELRLQEKFTGIGSGFQKQFIGLNDKLDHINNMAEALLLQILEMNKRNESEDGSCVADSQTQIPFLPPHPTTSVATDYFIKEITEIEEQNVFGDTLDSEMKVVCEDEMVETKLEIGVEENEDEDELIEKPKSWIGHDLETPVVVTVFSRDKVAKGNARKVFDKMTLREMESTFKQRRMKCSDFCLIGFKSSMGACLTSLRPLPKPPPLLDFYRGMEVVLKRQDESANIKMTKIVSLVKTEKWECWDDKVLSEVFFICRSKEGYIGREHSESCLLWKSSKPSIMIMSPELVREVMSKRYVNLKLLNSNPLTKLLAQGVVSYEESKWAIHGKLSALLSILSN